MDPSVTAESVLLGANITLGHGKYLSDPIKGTIVLTDTPFLCLSWVICHVRAACRWLEGGDEDGKELRVPVGEPSGVNTAGQSMLVVVRCVKWPLEFCN